MTDLPTPYKHFREEFPEVAAAYDALGNAAHQAGPLDEKTRQLIKLALAIGARLEGATHAHTRRAVEMGISPAELKHAVALCVTTLGFPAAMVAYTWINDILED